MGLVARHDAHAAQGCRHRGLVDRRELVVLARDHLLVVGIGSLDEPREHQGAAGPKPDVIVALGDLELGLGRVEPADLLERLGRHDQVGGGAPARGHVHLGQPVAVGRHHAHAVGAKLPQDSVENRPAFLGGGGERHVRNQFVDDPGGRRPGLVDLERREGRELLPRQAEELAAGAPALDRHALLPGGGHADRGGGELADDVAELLRRESHRPLGIHVGGDRRAHGDVEVGP